MLLIAENLVEAWDTVKTQFAKTKPLKDKNLFITMMYQSWELCDGVFTKWSEANATEAQTETGKQALPTSHLKKATAQTSPLPPAQARCLPHSPLHK